MTRRTTTAAALAAALMLLAGPAAASATGGADYLRTRLTRSGGIAEAGTSRPSVSLTEWSVMGLAAAGRRPERMHRTGGRTPARFLARRARRFDDAFEIERGILAAVAMRRPPRQFGGRNLVRALRRTIRAGGRIGALPTSTYWGLIALRAARSPIPDRSVRYVVRSQRSNGGFAPAPGAAPDSNDTAAAVLALRAARRPCSSRPIRRAFRYLNRLQRGDGGYPLTPGAASDSQSTAWVVQARQRCDRGNRGALRYLRNRKRPNGAYNYRRGLTLTPAWVTAQVLPAVNRRPYPVRR